MESVVVLTREEVAKSVKALRPLPKAVARLVELAESETATIKQIAEVVNADPVLCGKILQVVNSAYYGLARSVSTIQQALMLLGLHSLKAIALSVVSIATLSRGRAISAAERVLWEHALSVAWEARGIAQACRWGVRVAEDAYVVGLLHDIGALFLLMRYPSLYKPLVQVADERTALERELELFGCDHADVGAMIAEHWDLPERIVKAIGAHHAPVLPDDESQLLTAAVMAAERWQSVRGFSIPQGLPAGRQLDALVRLDHQQRAHLKAEGAARVEAMARLLLS